MGSMVFAERHGQFVVDRAQLEVPGAWRALDHDLSGYITLAEIEPEACQNLIAFKGWSDEEFGGVRNAFKARGGAGDRVQSGCARSSGAADRRGSHRRLSVVV